MGELSTMTTRAMSVSTVLSSFTKFPSFITHDARKNLQHDAIYKALCKSIVRAARKLQRSPTEQTTCDAREDLEHAIRQHAHRAVRVVLVGARLSVAVSACVLACACMNACARARANGPDGCSSAVFQRRLEGLG